MEIDTNVDTDRVELECPALNTHLGVISRPSQAAADEIFRRNCKNSLPFFAKNVLGYKDISAVHEDMWSFYLQKRSEGFRKFLFLIPRNHLKTTFWSISYPIWKLLNKPDNRILLANAVWDNARTFLRSIKGQYDTNTKFRDLFGDWQGDVWTNDNIIVDRRRNKVIKEPSITTVGVEKSVTSQHYDTLIFDDLVERVNVNSPAGRDSVKSWIQDAFNLVETGFDEKGKPHDSEIIMLGTRYDDDDAYGWVMDELSEDWAIYVRQVIEDGKIIFPEKFTQKYIESLKASLGSSLFASQYYNSPIDEETAIFKRSTFKYVKDLNMIDGKPMSIDNFYWIMSVDPAYGTDKKADQSAIIVSAFHQPTGTLYIKYSWAGRPGAEGLNREIIKTMKMFPQVRKLGIETNASQAGNVMSLRALAMFHDLQLPIYELKPQITGQATDSKTRRITQALQPFIETGKVIFVGRHPDLEMQLSRFPKGKLDDAIDALSYQIFMVPMGRAVLKNAQEKRRKHLRRSNTASGYVSLTGRKSY